MILIDGYSYTSQTRQAPSDSPSNTYCWKGQWALSSGSCFATDRCDPEDVKGAGH